MHIRNQCLGLLFEPARHSRHRSRVSQDMSEEWLGYSHLSCESHISTVKGRDEWQVRETPDPRADNAVREPPVSVNYLWLEISSSSDCLYEIGTKEPD